jgi:prepilin-type N-terminal cleavage/methylation domain-containing protein
MTTFGQTRRDPQIGKKEFSTRNGFTVIELMVVIAVVAIITSFALPSYRTLIEKRSVTSGAQQISAFFSSAKMEAIKRNEMIAIHTDLSDACMGFFAYDPDAGTPRTDCDCTLTDPNAGNACAIDEFGDGGMGLHVLNASLLNKPIKVTDIDITGRADDLVVFDPIRGMLVFDGAVAAMPLELKMLSKKDAYGLNVQLTATGRVTVCTDTSTAVYPVPGFDDC